MQTFRVYGDKITQYYVDVAAVDSNAAYDIAEQLETHKWLQVEQDDVIEPHTVELQEQLDNN